MALAERTRDDDVIDEIVAVAEIEQLDRFGFVAIQHLNDLF
jgi:hypothetical protein